MKISIAICTYNGEKYLQEQLDSYAAQTRLPDEIVVCDDCSKDSTREILTTFAGSAAFPVKLYFNEQNLGYTQNFGKAAGLCTGDIIVLSDQDDIWRKDKLELIEAEFTKSEKIGIVYADAELVDENLRSFGLMMWQCNNFNLEKQNKMRSGKAFDLMLKDGYFLGSSMAIRAKFQDLILPVPLNIYLDHDDWFALLISAIADVSLINEPLIKYRQHQLQTSTGIALNPETGVKPLLNAGRRINKYDGVINQLNIAEERLSKSSYPLKEAIPKIRAAREHLLTRANLPKNPSSRLIKIGRELVAGHYHNYSNGFRSAAKDLLV